MEVLCTLFTKLVNFALKMIYENRTTAKTAISTIHFRNALEHRANGIAFAK